MSEVDEHLDALSFKMAEAANLSRSAYQSCRWEVTRLAERLVTGDHQPLLAKHVATNTVGYMHFVKDHGLSKLADHYLESVHVNPTSEMLIKENKFSLFTEYKTDVGQYISASLVSCDVETKAKCKQLDELLIANPKYVGTVGHVSKAKLEPDFVKIATIGQTDESGSEGWAVAAYQNYRRGEAAAIPLPGSASLFCALDQAWVVYSCSLQQLCAKGVAVEDFENWLETEGGQTFAKTSMTTIVVLQNQAVYIPAGQLWACVHLEIDKYQSVIEKIAKDDSESDDEESKPKVILTENSVAHALVFPMFVQAWIEDLPSNVQLAITSLNLAVFEKKKSKSMWRERAASFCKAFKVDDKSEP